MKKIDLTQGKVLSVLTILALPIMGTSFLQFAYNIIDMIWVGGLGSNAVASIGSASFFVGLGYSINSLVVIGAGIKVSHSLGRKENNEARQYINAGLFINIILGLVCGASLIFFGKAFIGFLNINNLVVERDAYSYLVLSAPTLFFTFFNLFYARILGSYGNNKEALKISVLGIVISIVLDPVFIYILKLGVPGAALGSLVANIVMFLVYRIKFKGSFNYNKKIGLDYKKVNEIVKLGAPMAFQRILFTLINIILARIIAKFGSDALAAQKIGLQIESLGYMVIGGFQGAIASFTGQNFGAKRFERIKEGYNAALKIGIIYSLILTVVFIFFNVPLIKIFIREDSTIAIASSYLQVIGFSQIFSTIEVVSNGLFTGIGKPNIPAAISVIFTALRIPMALLFTIFLGLNGIWLSIALSSMFKGIAAYLIYIIKVRKESKNVEEN
ncbi:MAG TPA: MATE family efflux transporter [Clostridium sp.]